MRFGSKIQLGKKSRALTATLTLVGIFAAAGASSADENSTPGSSSGNTPAMVSQDPSVSGVDVKAKTESEKTSAPAKAPAKDEPKTMARPGRPNQEDIDKLKAVLAPQMKKECNRHFPALIQTEVRAACNSAADSFAEYGQAEAGVKCRLIYGEEPREAYSCLIGVDIANEIIEKKEDYKRRLQLCADQYPAHTEIDSFLQESCLTGIYMPNLVVSQPSYETCAQISEERSFIGPCQVGFSLAHDMNAPATPNEQNHLCEQYFDHNKFHTGYRACLNGRGAAATGANSMVSLLQSCSVIASSASSDTERAACLIGANIYQHLTKKDDVAKRFQKCGTSKVSYDDRDFLACLTAASALDITSSKGGAESACKEIFHTVKGSSRGDCIHSLTLF